MKDVLARQTDRVYAVLSELMRRYQFRDRDQICCHGLSVSQCYTLELLADGQPRSMRALADETCLKVSSATRVVDQLVSRDLVERMDDPNDRRVCRVRITNAGRSLVSRVRAEIIGEYRVVLEAVPPESREAVIDSLTRLLAVFKNRQCTVVRETRGEIDGKSVNRNMRSGRQRCKVESP